MSGMTFHTHEIIVPARDPMPDSVLLAQEFLSDILLNIDHLEDVLTSKEFHWNRLVSDLTQDIVHFVELSTLMTRTMIKNTGNPIKGAKESHIHLLFILKGVREASHKQDFTVLHELIKYELKDNLTQWKIDLIPQVKRLLNH